MNLLIRRNIQLSRIWFNLVVQPLTRGQNRVRILKWTFKGLTVYQSICFRLTPVNFLL